LRFTLEKHFKVSHNKELQEVGVFTRIYFTQIKQGEVGEKRINISWPHAENGVKSQNEPTPMAHTCNPNY
jgi:hypothetical protein